MFRGRTRSSYEPEGLLQAQLNPAPWASLPVPVSPKSMYRLADEHRIIPWGELALESIIEGLTVQGVLAEVSSPFARQYDEVRRAAVQFLAYHWVLLHHIQS
ncbi:hypothetical protein BT69DRAFT_1289566 [Atractiella rhizophila]|nr:hypothetical protein BT69DRAFT_1289566 [Atractiella rhizophila]